MPDPTTSETVDRDESTRNLFIEATFADAPERIPLLPVPGIYPHPSYGDVDLSAGVIDTMVANFQREVYPQNLPIDCEHSKDSGAAGWIKALHRNEDGSVDASVEWNAMGKQLLAEDRFRYVSPSFRPEWTNPATRETHKNVLIGAGLTTRPYFKPGSLRPLIVASEPTAERKEPTVPDPKPTNPAPEPTPNPVPEPAPAPEPTPEAQDFSELNRQFAELQKANTTMSAELTRLREEQEERTFRDALQGVPEDQLPKKLAYLKALPADLRKDFIEDVQTEVARVRSFASRSEIGSDALGGNPQGAFAEATRKAAELLEKKPNLTKEQAFAEVVKAEPGLYRRYQAEKQA